MEVSLNLLNKYVKIDDQDPKELADKITSIGLEVEGMVFSPPRGTGTSSGT